MMAPGKIIGLRIIAGNVELTSIKSMHTTAARKDFFSWFKHKKNEQNDPAIPAKNTKELIKDIESGKKSKLIKKEKLDLRPENFIGEHASRTKEKVNSDLVDKLSFNKWLNESKVLNEQQLNEISLQCFNNAFHDSNVSSVSDHQYATPFPDLVTKFTFTKDLQAKTGHLISDDKLTTLNTPLAFMEYYMKEILSGKRATYKESEPNAIKLSSENFSSPNVYIKPDVDTKSQKKRFGKILHEVQTLEAEYTKRIIEQARKS